MNKHGLYKTVEQAIKQYYAETGVLLTEIRVIDFQDVSTHDRHQCLIKLSTEEEQTRLR